jgi:poly(3-hydroxybutyrate) depolymerase
MPSSNGCLRGSEKGDLGGGHTWPGMKPVTPGTTETIDASELMLDFFDKHPRR